MVNVRYITHACFEITDGKRILIDPYFTDNPSAPVYKENPDIIFITHEHFDHADASRFNSRIVATPEVKLKNQLTMKIGDEQDLDGVKAKMIRASHHQSKYPTGYILTVDGKRIAHLGDTYLDGVEPIGKIDLLLLPIGGFFTMNIDEAIKALEIIKPNHAIPMHYNTFDQIKADPYLFKAKAEAKGFHVTVLKPLEVYRL